VTEMKDGLVSAPAEVWVAWVRDNIEHAYALERTCLELEDVLVRYRQMLKIVLARMGDFDALVECQRLLRETRYVGLETGSQEPS